MGDADGDTDGDPDGDDEGTASADDVGDADADAEGDAPSEDIGVVLGDGSGVTVPPGSPLPSGVADGKAPSPSVFSGDDVGVISVSDTVVVVRVPKEDAVGDTVTPFPVSFISPAWAGKVHVTTRPSASSQAVIRFIGLVLLFFCSFYSFLGVAKVTFTDTPIKVTRKALP
ncbi:MAG: hypothetical protein K2P30_01265 [Lachnospiraceae bacterium]|nr:hypothetical protein [Lachnospiraceae bacterium]